MRNETISVKFKFENKEIIQYYYEGILTDDFKNAGIIEFDKSVLKEIIDNSSIQDFTNVSAGLFIEKKMRIVRLCKYPLLSEEDEDYQAIFAFAYIIERYLFLKKLPKTIYCLSQKDLNFLKGK